MVNQKEMKDSSIKTLISNGDNSMVPKSNNRVSNFNAPWFELLIDKNNEINVFQIKRNKKVYLLVNFLVFLIYFISTIFCIASIVIANLNIDYDTKTYFGMAMGGSTLITLSCACICGGGFSSFSAESMFSSSNRATLIHSKYLIDKFLYFYNIDLSDLIPKKSTSNDNNILDIKYLCEKDISEFVIKDNIKNSGIISKLFLKNKDKAIKLMKLNIKYFSICTILSSPYIGATMIISFCIIFII